jgi:hypothetical protein
MDKSNGSSASTSTSADADKDTDAPETKSRRLMEKDDSGISVEKSGNSSDDDLRKRQASSEGNSSMSDLFPKMRSHSKTRNYRKATHEAMDTSSEEEEEAVPPTEENVAPESPAAAAREDTSDTSWQDIDDDESSSSTSTPSDSPVGRQAKTLKMSDTEDNDGDDDKPLPAVLLKQKPKHKWSMVHEVIGRYKHDT